MKVHAVVWYSIKLSTKITFNSRKIQYKRAFFLFKQLEECGKKRVIHIYNYLSDYLLTIFRIRKQAPPDSRAAGSGTYADITCTDEWKTVWWNNPRYWTLWIGKCYTCLGQ